MDDSIPSPAQVALGTFPRPGLGWGTAPSNKTLQQKPSAEDWC